MFRVMGSMMPYRNMAYDIYRKNFSEASAVGFLSAILFTVFCEPVKNLVDFGHKWMELSGIPYQMNIALLGFIVGYGTTKIFVLMRMQLFRMLLAYQGWMFNPKSTTTKMWALMLNLLRGNGNYPTFYFEPLLPRLPIPDLNKTLDRFLLSMKPLVSDDEYVELLATTETFRVKEGPQLHNYLMQRSIDKRNWLSDIWLDLAYLSWREPSAVNVNCYALDRKNPATNDQLARASCLIFNIVKVDNEEIACNKQFLPIYTMFSKASFLGVIIKRQYVGMSSYLQICDETMVPQYMQDLIPITMEGYKHMNCTVRIPRPGRDEIYVYENQKHVVVYRKGVYFKLDVFKKDSDGKEVQVTMQELNALLLQIMEIADDSKDFCPVGVFTSQHRDYWAKLRERIIAIDTNRESIQCVDSCIAFFVLEDESPKSLDEEGLFSMTGTGTNRYFDKCLQYIIYPNGVMCVNAEHASGDATLPGRIWEYCLAKEMGVYDEEGHLPRVKEVQLHKLTPPQRLEWDLSNFEHEISESLEHFKQLSNSFDLRIISSEYGKGFMKKKRMSPDGYLQMIIQLAYYRIYGKSVKTYESASTRMYFNGRTETIRPVTEASVSWCKAMSSVRATKDQKILLLRRAINAQTKLKNEAVVGQGWDRHIFALYYVSKEMGIEPPALFQNKNVFMPDVLSTSQTPTKYTENWSLESSCLGGGFSAVNPDGYGVSYILVGEDIVYFHVSANKNSSVTSVQKMSDAILDSMNEVKTLLQ